MPFFGSPNTFERVGRPSLVLSVSRIPPGRPAQKTKAQPNNGKITQRNLGSIAGRKEPKKCWQIWELIQKLKSFTHLYPTLIMSVWWIGHQVVSGIVRCTCVCGFAYVFRMCDMCLLFNIQFSAKLLNTKWCWRHSCCVLRTRFQGKRSILLWCQGESKMVAQTS